MKGLRDITNSDRLMKEQSGDKFRFTIKKAVPRDSGTYWMVARNELGTDRAHVTITVGPGRMVVYEKRTQRSF